MNPPPRIEGIVETVLYVDDLPRAVAFYRDELGLVPMTGDPERFQSFQVGSQQVLLLFKRGGTLVPTKVPGGTIPPHDGHGPHHIGFSISAGVCAEWRSRLLARGLAIESETDWSAGGHSLFLRDPDGHLVELITPGIWPNY